MKSNLRFLQVLYVFDFLTACYIFPPELTNPCEENSCQFGAKCVPSVDGVAFTCECPEECPSYGDHIGSRAVCGSNGVDYRDVCELRRAACSSKTNLTIKYHGKCDPCDEISCAEPEVCRVSKSRNPECVCGDACPVEFDPVCGSDGKTYNNECELRQESCKHQGKALRIIYQGKCESVPLKSSIILQLPPNNKPIETNSIEIKVISNSSERHVCHGIRCDFDATCELGADGSPRCVCIFDCLKELQSPVCGSDLKIYPSVCALKMAACQRQEELRLRPLDLCQGMEVKPCNGELPVFNLQTGVELDCGSGPNREDCPSDSYCHITQNFARCCRKDFGIYLKSCLDSWYGCCPDNKTLAQGPDDAGCPSTCGCNKIGSTDDTCIEGTEQCNCKQGVGGIKCDRCEPGFWGLTKLSTSVPAIEGCLKCGCSQLGSVREDCEQMTGQCVCKPGVTGSKCTHCLDPSKELGPQGCMSADITTPIADICRDKQCSFGAQCIQENGEPICECIISCPKDEDSAQTVCGNDGETFASECHLKLYACHYQKNITVQYSGPCKTHNIQATDWPLKPYSEGWVSYGNTKFNADTRIHFTKSTRHIFGVTQGHDRAYSKPITDPTPIFITDIPMPQLLGDLCMGDSDCTITHSSCQAGACSCDYQYVASTDRRKCDIYDIPSFNGTSYIVMKTLKAYNKLSLEIEFKTNRDDGILLYNQQHTDGTGDFVSLAIVNGFVEFRFNLGNGIVILTSPQRVLHGQYHRVIAKRYHRDGLLQLDSAEAIGGQSQGTLKALDLADKAYVGQIPNAVLKVHENIGTSAGFDGCIRKLKIGRHIVRLHSGQDALVESTHNMENCQPSPTTTQ